MLRWLTNKATLSLIVAGGIYYGYTHIINGAGGGPAGMMGGAAPVSVAEVLSRNVQQWSEFSGRLVAADSAEIRARVSGTVEKINFTEGQWVDKGQSLFTIDQRPYAAALQAAQAQATLAEAEFSRARQLIADKAIAQREFDQRRSEAESARAQLTRAQLDVEHSLVRSPIAGRVGRAEVTVGNLVDAGGNATVLTTVVASKPIYADIDIDEQSYLRYMHDAGTDPDKLKEIPVQLSLSGAQGTTYTGHVQSFDNKMNSGSGTLRVRTVFDNADGSLIPGLFARVRLGSVGEVETVLITDRAIKTDQSIKHVWVVGEDNKTSYRPVKLGSIVDGLRVITDGLKAGEKIVVNGTQRIMMPGQPITPQMVPMDAPETEVQAPAEKTADEKKPENEKKPEASESESKPDAPEAEKSAQ